MNEELIIYVDKLKFTGWKLTEKIFLYEVT